MGDAVLFFRRNATRDFELRGHHIKVGDKISLWYISANRDEDLFEDPFRSTSSATPTRTSPSVVADRTSASTAAGRSPSSVPR